MMPWRKAHYLQKRAEWLSSQTFVLLAIQVPKNNDKTPQSAEQFFAALHGIYRKDPIAQEHIGFEIVAHKDSIIFYVFTPLHLRDFIEGQLYAQYPDLQINQVTDYTKQANLEGKHVATAKVQLTKEDVYPIKTFVANDVDPLASITAVLSGLQAEEMVWFQMVIRPVGDEWQERGVTYVNAIRSGKKQVKAGSSLAIGAARLGGQIIKEIIQPGSGVGDTAPKEPPKLSAPQEAALKGVESKITKLGYETLIRVVAIGPEATMAKGRIQAMLAALKQYNTTNQNGFTGSEIKIDDYPSWEKFISREFEEKGNILNIEELASIYHFPMQSVETSAISWAGSKKGEAPFNLPLKEMVDVKELTLLGKTDFRNSSKEFGIKLDDRKRHIYVIGKSGTGKTTLIENMAIDDVLEGRGIIVVDPHGELADKIVDCIPEERIQDVVILDPSDREFPIAFNLLEKVGDDYKGMVASGFVGIFKKIFGNSWGPRLEYILRNTVLALLDSENSTMLGIPRMLTDSAFRSQTVEHIKDAVIRDFWVNEFAAMDAKQRTEAVAPILNKVGQFLSTSTIRNIVGQPKSTIDIRRIMDEQKILVVNLSKGKIGEDNMALLGSMIITKVQLAAMSRANVTVEERPDCFLYVDEFQNFATESFATILSEARKYNLGLTIAHQYIAQMTEEVKDAVIGNVGTLITFRIGSPDATVLEKEFLPVFDVNDLINLQKAHVYIKLLIDGIAAPAFSAQTLPPRKVETPFRPRVVEYSRHHYTRPRAEVEEMIEETAGYKKKREAEEVMKQAQAVLMEGANKIGIDAQRRQGGGVVVASPPQVTTPVSIPKPDKVPMKAPEENPPLVISAEVKEVAEQQPVKKEIVKEEVAEVVEALPVLPTSEVAPSGEQGKPPKPLRTLQGWVYREVAQKGGNKWFLGEKEALYQKRMEAKLNEKNTPSEITAPEFGLEEVSQAKEESDIRPTEGGEVVRPQEEKGERLESLASVSSSVPNPAQGSEQNTNTASKDVQQFILPKDTKLEERKEVPAIQQGISLNEGDSIKLP